MPQYYFHTANGGKFHDHDGLHLPNNEAARTIGLRYLAEIVRDQPEVVGNSHDLEITITDQAGLILFVVSAHSTAAPTASSSSESLSN